MSSSTKGDSGCGEGSAARHFRLPALEVAAAEFRAQKSRAMRGPIGCLFLLAGSSLAGAFLLFFDVGGRVVLIGLASFLLSIVLVRLGLGIVFAWVAAIGAGATAAGAMLMSGIEAAWVYWTLAGLFGLVGFLLAGSGSKVWPGFVRARNLSAHAGCRIAFFRPFHSDYTAKAKNLLLPLLRGYGTVFFVVDESFDESEFDGLWSKDYQTLPGLVGGNRYTDDKWQSQVQMEIQNIDVAVVDISVPSANVVWEIKQCYDQLPSHRIILVVSAAVFPAGLPSHFEDRDFQTALWAHIESILRGLKELGANPITKPLCLIYSAEIEGQVWLANAFFQAMANITALEAGKLQPGR